jgi:hypothetical protein
MSVHYRGVPHGQAEIVNLVAPCVGRSSIA